MHRGLVRAIKGRQLSIASVPVTLDGMSFSPEHVPDNTMALDPAVDTADVLESPWTEVQAGVGVDDGGMEVDDPAFFAEFLNDHEEDSHMMDDAGVFPVSDKLRGRSLSTGYARGRCGGWSPDVG